MPPTPRILKVVCRGTAELDAKNLFYKVIAPYIESLSRLGAVPRCNPTTLTTRNVDRLRKSFEEDIAADLNDGDSRRCRVELEVLYILYRALELFELQGCQVAFKFLSDIVAGGQTEASVRSELNQNEKFEDLRCQLTKMEADNEDVNDSTMKYKILKLADIVEKHLCTTVTVSRILIAVPTAAVCEEVNKMLASIPNLATSYVYDTTRYNKNVLKNFVESSDNCIVVISSAENLKGQNIPLAGISLAICLDVQKDVFRKPPYWQGSIYMLLSDIENKSFQGSVFATSPKKPPATLKSALANQSTRGRKGFLTKEEQNYFERHLKCSTKIVLPSRDTASSSRSQSMNTVHLSLTRWRPWQSKLQETYLIGHSADSAILVDILQFCDELTEKSDGVPSKDYDDEVAAHLRTEDVHFCDGESEIEIDSHIGANVDSFDIEMINSLAISSEMDPYVLDSAEKFVNYLAELGLNDINKLQPPSSHNSNLSDSLNAEPVHSPKTQQIPRRDHNVVTPHATTSDCPLNRSIKIDSSPLAVGGRVPLASTPSTGAAAPRANFKVTPIAKTLSKRLQSTPNSHLPGGSLRPDLESSGEASKLGLTALVNFVQKRKKQKNLQYFFSDKVEKQAQLSDIVEAVDSSSKEEIQETNHERTASSRSNVPQHFGDAASECQVIIDTNMDRGILVPERPRTESEDEHLFENFERDDGLCRSNKELVSQQKPVTDSCRLRDQVEDDDEIFDDIDLENLSQKKAGADDYIEIASSDEEVEVAQERKRDVESPSGKYEITKHSEWATSSKIEPKRKIRSVFDALDEIDKKEESFTTHTALLDIISNIPTRSKELDDIPEMVECKPVGNILPIEVQNEMKRTLDNDEDSDDLFDCVEEPRVLPSEKAESQDVVLEELLKKADGRLLKQAAPAVSEGSKACSSRQEADCLTNKGFRKQKLKDTVETRDFSERAESSPESIKMSFSAPQARAMKMNRDIEKTTIRSRSQKEYSAVNNRKTPLAERSLSRIFESRDSEIRKRARFGSGSSSDSSPIQKRRKPTSNDGSSPVKPKARRNNKNQYFDDEAEVDSIDSVTEDEDEQNLPNGYEIDSFVVDEEPIPHSQGMYHRLNRELSPRQKHRRPLNVVPYEDCFSQRPPSGEDTYEEDSFVDNGSVADVTLPNEITIMQAPSETCRRKKKTTRRVFMCDESSEGDPSDGDKSHRNASPQSTNSSKQSDDNLKNDAARKLKSESASKSAGTTGKNVIVVNMALLGILPDILIGLQRTFSASHIEPVDTSSFGDHPVDIYLAGLCIKLLTVEQLRMDGIKAQEHLRRLESITENPVVLVMTPAGDPAVSERLLGTIIKISDMNMRTFFVKNQVEVLMLLKCIAKDLSGNEWLLEFLESQELHRLLKIPHLNVLTATALLKENLGKAQRVIQTSSVDDIKRTCGVSERFAKTICVALRKS